MNYLRVVRSTNILLLLAGYQVHWFASKSQRFRLSLPAILNVVALFCVYLACFVQHFEPSALLQMLKDVSPYLYGLTRTQLVISIKVFLYSIFASVRAISRANAVLEILPFSESRRGFSKEERTAYALLYSTFLVLLCFGFYIAYEMEFKLPPLEDCMIGLALFIPHFILGGALRFYCIIVWLGRVQLQNLSADLEENLRCCTDKNSEEIELTATSTTLSVNSTATTVQTLESKQQQLELLAQRLKSFFEAMRNSLLLLFGINTNCLLAGVYSYVYYSNIWYVMFSDVKRRVFYAGNIAIYVCILCDYICLLGAQSSLEQEGSNLFDKLSLALKQRDSMSKGTRRIVKDMRSFASKAFKFQFSSLFHFDVKHFVIMQVLQGIVLALIVVYQYLHDGIVSINERLDSSDDA